MRHSAVSSQQRWSTILWWVGALSWPTAAQAEPPVTLHYVQRPPYTLAAGEGLTGLTGGPAYQAFKDANIPVQVQETPFARQLRDVEMNTGWDCIVGAYKNAEREKIAKFSKPIYRSQPHVLLTSPASAPRLAVHPSVQDVFSDRSLVLLVKLGYSYGAAVDALIAQYQPRRQTTADESLAMLRQIRRGMADYMLMAPEEVQGLVEAAGLEASDVRQISPKNMPAGEYRYLMCSKNVPDAVMEKLNAAIRFKK